MNNQLFNVFCLGSTLVWLPLSSWMVSRFGLFGTSPVQSFSIILFMILPPFIMAFYGWYYESQAEDLTLSELRRELSFANSQLNRLSHSVKSGVKSVSLARTLVHSLASLAHGSRDGKNLSRVTDHVFELIRRNLQVRKASLWLCDAQSGIFRLVCFHGFSSQEIAETTVIEPHMNPLDEDLCFPLVTQGTTFGFLRIDEADELKLLSSGEEKELLSVLAWILALHCNRLPQKSVYPYIEDDLTSGIYSYEHMMKLLHRESSRALRYGEIYTVLHVEISHYTSLVELHGEDELQRLRDSLALLLSSLIREMDVVGQYGEGAYIVMLPQTHKGGGIKLARRIENCAVEQLCIQGGSITIEAIVSVASFPEDGKNENQLISNVSDDWRDRVQYPTDNG